MLGPGKQVGRDKSRDGTSPSPSCYLGHVFMCLRARARDQWFPLYSSKHIPILISQASEPQALPAPIPAPRERQISDAVLRQVGSRALTKTPVLWLKDTSEPKDLKACTREPWALWMHIRFHSPAPSDTHSESLEKTATLLPVSSYVQRADGPPCRYARACRWGGERRGPTPGSHAQVLCFYPCNQHFPRNPNIPVSTVSAKKPKGIEVFQLPKQLPTHREPRK